MGANFVRNGLTPVYDTTIEITAYSVRMDSVATNHLTSYAIGSINDPEFGVSKAGLIMQVTLPTTSAFNWANGVNSLDSLVLQLRFRTEPMFDGTYLKDYYGEKEAVHTLNVYKLTEDLNWDSLYFSRRKPAYDENSPIGSWTGKFNFTDSIRVKFGRITEVLPPHIRIALDTGFKNQFFSAGKSGSFNTISSFKTAFKGFVIVDKTNFGPNDGSVVFVKLNSDVTELTAYHDSSYDFFPVHINTEAAYNYYEQENVPTNLLQNFTLHSAPGKHRDKGYVQPLGGAKLRIEFSDLFDNPTLKNPKLTINGAELVLPVLAGTISDKYTLPKSMLLHGSDSLGKNVLILDEFDPSYYGGLLNTNFNEYHFNIARHVQFLLDERKKGNNYNYGLNLVVSAFSPVSAQRVIFDTNKSSGKFKLKLTYTVIK